MGSPRRHALAENINGHRTYAQGSSDVVTSIIGRIDELIALGRLIPGQRLIEPDLMRELGVTRSPLREALRILAGDGVIELVPNRGARVRQLNVQEMISVLEVVGILLCAAIEFLTAGKDRLAAALPAVRQATDKIEEAVKSGDPILMCNRMREYQSVINHWCGNPMLEFMVSKVHPGHYHHELVKVVKYQTIIDGCRAYCGITAALEKREFDQALKLARKSRSIGIESLKGN